ncbi:Protein MIZU-KUSSEI 1-like plant protein [Dioscorea alata]|uniref:Protein MIZU-KUSSEI 1-like plant protein n=1 Tax=Dioscorea alata TaxID=55571 RepID=A0ACB7TS21_DIOAL|nr:Protein MIZU-KUSSEI 1-like plant protein [Dioscorea alata]
MRTIMARTPHDSSSRRHFQWIMNKIEKVSSGDNNNIGDDELVEDGNKRRQRPVSSISRFRSALTAAIAARRSRSAGLGPRVTGTLFGRRRGHVHFAFQTDSRSSPAALIELATPTSTLVREMASGLVRIALECERRSAGPGSGKRLLEEPLWRAYCNGKKCGYAVRRECGTEHLKVLKAVENVSMGAGVLPGDAQDPDGEMMYMRARFERVIGSKDSEAFYMMNPDGNGGPELSIYLLRV